MPRPKGSKNKPWIKLWSGNWLRGSIARDTLAQVGFWSRLLALANEHNPRGLICFPNGKPYPKEWLAGMFNCSQETYEVMIKHHTEQGRIIVVDGVINVVNFNLYQDDDVKPKLDPETQELRELSMTRNLARKHPGAAFDAVIATEGESPAYILKKINMERGHAGNNGNNDYQDICAFIQQGFTGSEIYDHYINGVVLEKHKEP